MISALTGQGINVRYACRVLGVSESGYYAWRDRPDPPRTLRRIWLAGEIADVHKASGGAYGEMRVTAELRYGRDIVVGHNAVGQIMREFGVKGLPTRRLPRGARVPQVTHLDLVRREFGRDGPNQDGSLPSGRGLALQAKPMSTGAGGFDAALAVSCGSGPAATPGCKPP